MTALNIIYYEYHGHSFAWCFLCVYIYTCIYIYRVTRGLRAPLPFMCGPCYVLHTFGFSLFLWPVLGRNVRFCVCCATVPCTGTCCGCCLWDVVCVRHGVPVG